jgi:hypothetical protein
MLDPDWPFFGVIRQHDVKDARESKANRMAGITNNQGCADLSKFLGRKRKATGSSKIADP